MNYMSEVAKMLGVELGEEFTLKGFDYTYKLTEHGLICTNVYNAEEEKYDNLLVKLLVGGHYTIKRKPWKPKFEEEYFSVGVDGTTESGVWLNDFLDHSLYKIGNCYRTIEEARANRSKWGAFYDSDEVLEV